MKLRAALLLLVPCLATAAPFEGVLTGRLSGPHVSGTSRTLVSAAGLRTEMQLENAQTRRAGAGPIAAISLHRSAEPGKVYVLDPARKRYRIETPPKKAPGKAADWKVEKLGAAEVAGLPCEWARATSKRGDRVEVCLSKEVGEGAPWQRSTQDAGAGATAGSAQALAAAGVVGYPLRFSLQAKGGASALTVEVTAAERKPVPPESFALPDGYEPTKVAPAPAHGAPKSKR